MTVAGQSTGHQNAVGSILKGTQQVYGIHPTSAHDLNDLDRRRVLHAQAAGEVGRVVGTMAAAEGDDLRLEIRHLQLLSAVSSASNLIII
jgi:hypothetical protein